MALGIYNDEPFNSGTLVDPVDLFNGDGVTTQFTVTQKSGNRIGSIVEFDEFQYSQYNYGYTRSGDTVTLSSAPPADSQGVVPGINAIVFESFDQDDVPGNPDSRVKEVFFYLADPDDIHSFSYEPLTTNDGIKLMFTDLISSAGASSTWVQLACTDAAGAAMTYLDPGEALYTPSLKAFGTVLASSAALASSVTCAVASSFIEGDYIKINPGAITQEIVKIVSIAGTTINTSGFDFDHAAGENIFTCGRKFAAKETTPLDATDGEAAILPDIGLLREGLKVARS